MFELISRIKSDHKEIQETLIEIRDLGIESPVARELLYKARDLILAHIELEDNEVYPKLLATSEGTEIASKFSTEMQELAPIVKQFFAKYENEHSDVTKFKSDIFTIIETLATRIVKEEAHLYSYLEKSA